MLLRELLANIQDAFPACKISKRLPPRNGDYSRKCGQGLTMPMTSVVENAIYSQRMKRIIFSHVNFLSRIALLADIVGLMMTYETGNSHMKYNQDDINWKSWKLIALCTDNNPNIFALRSPKATHLLPGEHWGD